MAINLNDKTNKSIAALASKIMQEQPTKVRDFTDTKPIESDMVQRVMNTGLKGNFIKEETKSVWDTSVDVKAHGDKKPTHTVHLIQHPKGTSGWRGSPRTLKVHVAANDDAEAIQHATTAASHHHDSSHDGEKWEKPFVPSNPMLIAHPVKRLKEEFPLGSKMKDAETTHRTAVSDYIKFHGGRTSGERAEAHADATVAHHHGQEAADRVKSSNEKIKNQFVRKPQVNEAEQIDELAKDTLSKYIKSAEADTTNKNREATKNRLVGKRSPRYAAAQATANALDRARNKRLNKMDLARAKMAKEEVEQVDESRFGKAIDPSKLSPQARARLAARGAAKKPVEAKPGTKLGDIAASFKKPEPKKEEPKEEPKPAAKPANKYAELRRQNMERMKQHQAAVAAGKVGGGGEQRSGGKLGSPGDVEKKGTEIKGDRGAEHAARTGEKDAGSVVSGTTKAQSERHKRKKGPESDEHEDMHEALKGNQHKIDANHNGKIDGQDFKLLRAKHKRGK